MTFNITWGKKAVNVRFKGIVTAQDLIDANNYLISNSEFENMHNQIFDFTEITGFFISKGDIEMIAAMDKAQAEWNKEMKVAIVTNDEQVIEINNKYRKLLEGTSWKVKDFNTLKEAQEWIKS
ncbi:MAG: STAS/SEC14 domain-containing protein [Bacteroidales bacterium]